MNDNTIYLGEDLGMGANKIFGLAGGMQFQSQVATDGTKRLSASVGMKQARRPLEIETGAGSFHVGPGAHDYGRPLENLDFDRLTGAPEMKALFYGSLTAYQKQFSKFTKPITMMVGLPLQMMSGEEAKENKEAVREWLTGKHTWKADGKECCATVERVSLTPQPVGALFDYLLDENGQMIASRRGLMRSEVGIISVGFNTLELLVVRDGSPLERFTAGQTSGVRRLLQLLRPDGAFSLGELDTQLRAGKLDTQAVMPVWAREVTGEIEKRWGEAARRFSRVLIVGGGAILLAEALTKRFPIGKAVVADDPILSIARGLYKLALYKDA